MYRLTMDDEQLRVVMIALEEYFRLRMNQWFDFTTEVALDGYEYDSDNPENGRLFDAYIERRNTSRDMFEAAMRVAAPEQMPKTNDMMIAEDIWRVIRYQRWLDRPEPKPHDTVDSTPPFSVSGRRMPKVEKED